MDKKATELSVLEYPYLYAAWAVDMQDHSKAFSVRKAFSDSPRAVEDYHLCGVYHKAGLPFTVTEINGLDRPELEPFQSIPLQLAEECEKAVAAGKKVLVPSGYCALAPAVAGGVQRGLGEGKKLGVIWVDAHSDNVILETTKRMDARFVGIPLSTIAGQTMREWGRDYCHLDQPVPGERILVSDARCSDEECIQNLRDAGIRRLTEKQFEDTALWKTEVAAFAEKVDAIFLMVDADIMNGGCIPAYFCEEPGGHDVRKVMENVRVVMETGKVEAFACFCVDFDKYDEGGDVTYLNGMRVIGAGLEAWK